MSMTENEYKNAIDHLKTGNVSGKHIELAIQALEAIQEYREVEHKLKELHGDWIDLLSFGESYAEWAIKQNGGVPQKIVHLTDEHVDMWNEYRAIGTIEEFKALKEKAEPKKVVPRHIREYDGFDDGECPTCGNSVLRDGFSNDIYCDECGQKLDWS